MVHSRIKQEASHMTLPGYDKHRTMGELIRQVYGSVVGTNYELLYALLRLSGSGHF